MRGTFGRKDEKSFWSESFTKAKGLIRLLLNWIGKQVNMTYLKKKHVFGRCQLLPKPLSTISPSLQPFTNYRQTSHTGLERYKFTPSLVVRSTSFGSVRTSILLSSTARCHIADPVLLPDLVSHEKCFSRVSADVEKMMGQSGPRTE